MATEAYAAGFFDGEGTVDIRYRKTHGGKYDRFELRCSMSQVNTEVLHWFHANFGGSVCSRKSGAISQWVVVGPSATDFLRRVHPFLIVKREQASIGLEFGETLVGPRTGTIKGYHRLPHDVWDRRLEIMTRLRSQRLDEGCRARNRNPLPASSAISAISQ